MSGKRHRPPGYLLHKPTGQARVRINGRDFYLGTYGSGESKERYHRLLAEHAAGSVLRSSSVVSPESAFTITDLVASYWRFAEQHYQKNGGPTGQLEVVRLSLRPVRELYGSLPVDSFGCRELKAVRTKMLSTGTLCRNEINRRVGVIRRAFRWGVSEDVVSASVTHALRDLLPLQRGRCAAPDRPEVLPVPDEVVNATLPYLPPVLRDVVQIQRLTGARPGEVLAMRPVDVDHTRAIWRYIPPSHKTEHYGKRRIVLIGPRAQVVLAPYLLRAPETFCFSPAESETRRLAEMRQQRQSTVQPSQIDRRKPMPARTPGRCYKKDAYNWAIRRACAKAGAPRWHPNQLRHTAATEIRAAAGLDVAAAVLGHARPDTTLIYAAHDLEKAAAIMERIG